MLIVVGRRTVDMSGDDFWGIEKEYLPVEVLKIKKKQQSWKNKFNERKLKKEQPTHTFMHL